MAATFKNRKSLNNKLNDAEISCAMVLAALGEAFFPLTFGQPFRVAIRFAPMKTLYRVGFVNKGRGILVTLAQDLVRLPHVWATVAMRALIDVEYYFENERSNALSTAWNKRKEELLAAVGAHDDWTFVAKRRNVFVRSKTPTEARLKEFIHASSIFRVSKGGLEFLTLKQIEKSALQDDPALEKYREKVEFEPEKGQPQGNAAVGKGSKGKKGSGNYAPAAPNAVPSAAPNAAPNAENGDPVQVVRLPDPPSLEEQIGALNVSEIINLLERAGKLDEIKAFVLAEIEALEEQQQQQ